MARSSAIEQRIMHDVIIKYCEPQRVVALRHTGEYTQINRAFEQMCAWAAGKGLFNGPVRTFGIFYDDPANTPAPALQSDACIAVPPAFKAEAPYTLTHTPGGRCAVLIHTGPYAELHKAYTFLYTEWLPRHGEAQSDQPAFEEYLNDPEATPPALLQTAVVIPLRDKQADANSGAGRL